MGPDHIPGGGRVLSRPARRLIYSTLTMRITGTIMYLVFDPLCPLPLPFPLPF